MQIRNILHYMYEHGSHSMISIIRMLMGQMCERLEHCKEEIR